MILLEPEVWNPWRGVIVFAIFVGFVIAVVVTIELMTDTLPRPGGQRVLPGVVDILPEMPLPPEPPLEDERLSDIHECHTIDVFTKVEEYRNDFPDAS